MLPGRGASRQEIDFLLTSLLEPSTAEFREAISQRLMEAIPMGHHPARYVEDVGDAEARMQLRGTLTDSLNHSKIKHDLRVLTRQGPAGVDLELGVFLISRLNGDPDVTPEEFRKNVDQLAKSVRPVIDALPASLYEEKLGALRSYLFEELGFRGNTENYYDPRNSYLTDVLETRRGIPVSLSVLCLLIARRVRLPMTGVGLPGHFIVKYSEGDYTAYVDPFNGGNLLTESDCLDFLTRQGLEASRAALAPSEPLSILKRMLRNLINYHSAIGNKRMERVIKEYVSILEGTSIRS
ncbi:MAG: hypothetical protein HY042_06305 [Spirochaetia bacterium]|nr:hypothetical protein [Spirochaetia bacterium]